MSKIRYVFAEVEGTDQVINGALTILSEQFLGVGDSRPPQAAPLEATLNPTPSSTHPLEPAKESKQKPERTDKTKAVPPADAEPRGAEIEVFALLQRAPLTSGEVISKLPKVNQSSVYAALSTMRQKGIVETRLDGSDGQRKNYLKAE